ncbi:MAG TPA: alpha/beta hydrolase [Streptosporangiaceae bacterium]|nr:alpha/beta hydrolase [Streptosporangiaceae bacterium]
MSGLRSLRLPPPVLRLGARQLGKRVLNSDLSWEIQRRRLDNVIRASPAPRGTVIAERDYGGVPARVVTAGGTAPGSARTVVHFHGGGYCVGSGRMALSWAAGLSAQSGARVVLPEYRLAPEHPHPAALADARATVSALRADVSPGSMVLSGDSAGGGLALALLIALRDAGEALPAGCVLLSPWLDLGRDWHADATLARRDVLLSPGWLEACATAYAGPAKRTDPAISPILAAHAGLPPLLIQAATHELLVPDADRLAASASEAGVDVTYSKWPRMWHDFVLQAGTLAAADSAVTQAAWFVSKVTT